LAAFEVITEVLHLVWKAAQASISCVVPINLYKNIVKGNVDNRLDDPYFLAIFDVIQKILENQIAVKSADTVDFIFDYNPRLAAQVPQWYQFTLRLLPPEHRKLIGSSPKFEDDEIFLPLQAADAQSWYYRRLFAERINDEPFPKDVPRDVFSDLDKVSSLISLWDENRLRSLVRGQTPASASNPRKYKDIREIIANANLG
jgi:hypothetical protein